MVSDDDVDVWCLMTMLMYGVVSDDDVDVWCLMTMLMCGV